MIKQFTLVFALFSIISFQLMAQTETEKSEPKTKVYKYKLKLSPINLLNKVDLQYYEQNVTNDELFESTIGNFNYDFGWGVERNSSLTKSLIADSTNGDAKKIIEDFNRNALKSINFDSAKIEIYINTEYNYSSLILGNDTLIGVKNNNNQEISYYLLSKKGNHFCKTESGSLNALHSSQNSFTVADLPYQILGHNFNVRKVKLMNKFYATTALMTNEIPETDNLIYNFQYPSDINLFPLQFSLFKNNNKYCFELATEKEVNNSKAISKKIKSIEERKFERSTLNELFILAGFEY